MLFSTEFTNVGGAREIDDPSSPLAPFELAVWGPESWFLPDLD
jgi:hypothetical protein